VRSAAISKGSGFLLRWSPSKERWTPVYPAALCQVYSDQASSHASILRRIAARLKKAEDDLAAVVQVYSDPASSLRTRLHNHPAPQDVVLSPMHETG
jgi:hypothetical protein